MEKPKAELEIYFAAEIFETKRTIRMANLFFEEGGSYKVGKEISGTDSSSLVELPTGKRIKVKKNHVLIEFSTPAPSEFLEAAQSEAEKIDLDLLWEFAPEEEFTAKDAASDYYGAELTAIQHAATVLKLQANPVYFYRKGRGVYRKAPAETLKLALAAIERKKQQELIKAEYIRQMVQEGVAPEGIAQQAIKLILHPDKNSIEWKAVSEAGLEKGLSPLRLLLSVGAIRSPWQWHVDSFFSEYFPRGTQFPKAVQEPEVGLHEELPLASVQAFSIDDSNTTEIDDALSVTPIDENRTRVGIHISAPGMGIPKDAPLDLIARERMSTVYAPGLKTTMLPESWIKAYSLDEGKTMPVISLYAVVDNETFSVQSTESRLERITVAKNLWYDKIQDKVTEEAVKSGEVDVPFGKEICWLWHLAKNLLSIREETRGRPELTGIIDWYFELIGQGEDAQIQLKGRKRGEPLDLLVAEMMIFANMTWGQFLNEQKTVAIYRTQSMGKVKMSTIAAPHDGMGVPCYSWATSPLRRYVDLVNQRQLIAVLKGDNPPYVHNDSDLFVILSSFDSLYTAFNDFQNQMNRYWTLRWLEQKGEKVIKATVAKGDLVRLDGLPMAQRVPGLPDLPRGQKVALEILSMDYIELFLECRLKEVLNENSEDLPDELVELAEEETAEKIVEEPPQEQAEVESVHPEGSDQGGI